MKFRLSAVGICLAALIAVPSLVAQTAAPGSLTGENTYRLFTTDADAYLDVNDFQDVDFSKFFVLLQGSGNGWVAGGFATHLGSLYLGLYYNGNILRGQNIKAEDGNEGWNDVLTIESRRDPTNAIKTISAGDDTGFILTDQFAFLLGSPFFGGIKLSINLADIVLDSDRRDITTPPGEKTGDNSSKSFNSDGSLNTTTNSNMGALDLSVLWGKKIGLGGGSFKPEIELGGSIDLAKVVDKAYTNVLETITSNPGHSSLNIGLRGEYEFAKKGNSQLALVFDEYLSLGFYPDALEKKEIKTLAVEGIPAAGESPAIEGTPEYTKTEEKTQDSSSLSNYLSIGLKKTYEVSDRFSTGFGFDIAFKINSDTQKITQKESDTLGTAYTYDLPDGTPAPYPRVTKNEDSSSFWIAPSFSLGFVYQIVPTVFSLNGGLCISPTFMSESWEDKLATGQSLKKTSTTTFALIPSFGIGGTLTFNNMLSLDLNFAPTDTSQNFNIDLTTLSLLATVKY
ncbi:hypothetical protein TREPR_3776 [Treponema primitia ZAS-2]|uniref:DUF5723 domain-containing protein n=1 Tax=Treponema primitia (strain ATCC BAA-887 / DSM 12427 / ZAS-2) TaxID=545694 RepID=F5YPR6_TREPZ|nr:hypothetical protein [Treponema primitia]AEF83845.1 hypothetical protein TREPR_3776 [Treponema primitia ZAS-2]